MGFINSARNSLFTLFSSQHIPLRATRSSSPFSLTQLPSSVSRGENKGKNW